MTINYFDYQETIAENLIKFMRLRGYSRLSLSKLTAIPRNVVDQLLKAENINPSSYNLIIMQINQTFDLPADYFLTTQATSLSPTPLAHRSPTAQKYFDGLENVLDIYSMYLK
jgi:hypothetical protein